VESVKDRAGWNSSRVGDQGTGRVSARVDHRVSSMVSTRVVNRVSDRVSCWGKKSGATRENKDC
jgi:hypothetical protein